MKFNKFLFPFAVTNTPNVTYPAFLTCRASIKPQVSLVDLEYYSIYIQHSHTHIPQQTHRSKERNLCWTQSPKPPEVFCGATELF